MNFVRKQYESDEDYWRIRGFFRNLRAEDPRPSVTWNVSDFDYWRWHTLENVWGRDPRELAYWEDPQGQIVAVLQSNRCCFMIVFDPYARDLLQGDVHIRIGRLDRD